MHSDTDYGIIPNSRIILAACLSALFFAFAFTSQAANAWFGGGSYDGYDEARERGSLDLPQVNNAAGATNIASTNAWLNGMLLTTGGAPAEVYVFWGQTDGQTDHEAWAHGANFGFVAERVALTTNVTLTPNSTYHYRFYATNTIGDEGWATASVTFDVPGPPEVTTGPGVLPLSRTTATLNGILTAGNSAYVSVYWGTDAMAWSHTNALDELGEGPFRLMLDELSPGTEYAYQVYATNDYGHTLSDVIDFTTVAHQAWFGGGSFDGYDQSRALGGMSMPQVNNAAGATNISSTSAWLNGMLISTGDAPAEVYVFWGQTDGLDDRNGWTYETNFGVRTAGEALTVKVAVDANSTYFYRFYATNAVGDEGWAPESAEFAVHGPPEVNNSVGVLPLGRTTATLNGELVAGDQAAVTVFWGSDPENLINSEELGSTSLGVFRVILNALTPSTQYYYRIKAENAYGIDESDVVSFVTVADTAWFGGGSFDGFDMDTVQRIIGSLPGARFLFR